MGRVYRAEQRMLGRTVAIKVVHPHLLSDEQSVARFYTEARAASRLNHPNSVSIIDFGRTDDGILFLVMEFLQGRDLARLVREDGPLSVKRVCDVVRAVLDALGEAHALDVVHRDLKPENVIIERLRSGDDLVKVVDFGLAKLLKGGQQGTGITLPGLVCGTPDYMSPEQGRGEEVDARGDLYSVGVMLFELLTGKLPFVADTPTNVVLRHIQDPVPDPRAIAPDRMISTALAALTMRALAKRPGERFADAAEMGAALRRVSRSQQASLLHSRCAACGHSNSLSNRFCAQCGLPQQQRATPSTGHRLSLPPRLQLSQGFGVLVARDEVLTELHELRDGSQEELGVIALLGDVGVGRTRLMAAVAERAASSGELVVGAGPHPSGAPVPYHAVNSILQSLLGIDQDGLPALRDRLLDQAPLVAAGLDELWEPVGLRGADGQSRAHAVAAAFEYALHAALQGSDAARALIMIDDVNRCDGLTQQVVRALTEAPPAIPGTLLVVGQGARELRLSRRAHVVELSPLSQQEARAVLRNEPYRSHRDADPDDVMYLPLYLEQLRELGMSLDGAADGDLPARLADAVSQRIARLPAGARRLLQAAAILGNECPRATLTALCRGDIASDLVLLCSRGLLVEHADRVEITHPFLRDLVEASIPAAARRDLHRRALTFASEQGAPLEVRGRHAYGSGEVLGALVLLERMGDLALTRGDVDSAVLGYQRALELARRELLESGDSYLEGAIESLSRRLGTALARRGDVVGAEGVLREALEFSAPASNHRAHILLGLADVLFGKQRVREARRFLSQALQIALLSESEATQVEAHIAMARLQRAEGEFGAAMASLSQAQQLLTDAEPDRLKLAQVAVDLAQLQVDLRQLEAARISLRSVEQKAHAAESPYLAARALGLSARVCAALGQTADAQRLYCEAAVLAERSGDGRLALRFRDLSVLAPESGRPQSIPPRA